MTMEEREDLPYEVEVTDILARTDIMEFFRFFNGYTFKRFEGIKFLYRCSQDFRLFVNTEVNKIYVFDNPNVLDKDYEEFTLLEYLEFFNFNHSTTDPARFVWEMYNKKPYYLENRDPEEYRDDYIQFVLNVVTNFASISSDFDAYDNRKIEIVTLKDKSREYIVFEEPITKIWIKVNTKPSRYNFLEVCVCGIIELSQAYHYQRFCEEYLHGYIEKIHESIADMSKPELWECRNSPEQYKNAWLENICKGNISDLVIEELDVNNMEATCYGERE